MTQQEETAEEAETRRKSEIEERQEQSRKLVEDTLKRELAESESSPPRPPCHPLALADLSDCGTRVIGSQRKQKLPFRMSMIRMDWIPKPNSKLGS